MSKGCAHFKNMSKFEYILPCDIDTTRLNIKSRTKIDGNAKFESFLNRCVLHLRHQILVYVR